MSVGTPCRVIRSRRRTLSLEITPRGEVLVRAPLRTSEAVIRRFVEGKQGWIETHLALVRERMAAADAAVLSQVSSGQADLMAKYGTAVDRQSAYEDIAGIKAKAQADAQLAAERAQLEKERAEFEKQKAAAQAKAEKQRAAEEAKEQRRREQEAAKAERARERREEQIRKQVNRQVGSMLGTIGREASRQIVRGIFKGLR